MTTHRPFVFLGWGCTLAGFILAVITMISIEADKPTPVGRVVVILILVAATAAFFFLHLWTEHRREWKKVHGAHRVRESRRLSA